MQSDVSVVVVGRDRFSPTAKCLKNLVAQIPAGTSVTLVLGGAPPSIQKELEKGFGERVRLIFPERLLNPAQSRNIGLKEAKTRLAVLMDNDVFVRPGWLAPLLKCQIETGAAMVVPLILEPGGLIHTAGNDLYVTYDKGEAFANKELRFAKMAFCGKTNLERRPTDYGELHCQMVDVQTALRLGAFDETLIEAGECDSGLSWKKAGCGMWFEPESVVFYDFPNRIRHAEDVPFFLFKWDMRETLKSYRYFKKKWNLDISGRGSFGKFLVYVNDRVGLLSRLWPSQTALFLDDLGRKAVKTVSLPAVWWGRYKARIYGHDGW